MTDNGKKQADYDLGEISDLIRQDCFLHSHVLHIWDRTGFICLVDVEHSLDISWEVLTWGKFLQA